MPKPSYCLAACVLSVLMGAPAAGRDILVSNASGDDTFSGHHWEAAGDRTGPVQTIAKALRLAQTGDRIVLANTGRPYRESLSLVGSRHGGYAHQPFILQGNGAILDGSAAVPPEAWEHYDGPLFRFRPPSPGYQQLFLNDRPVPQVFVGRLAEWPPRLQPLEWCLLEGCIYFCVEQGKLPRDYPLTYAQKQTGITLYHVDRVAIVDLIVQGFRLDGISAFNSAREIQLEGVTCRSNGRSGMVVGGASTVNIEACLAGNNSQAQLLTLPCSETRVRNSQLLPLSAAGWVDQGGRFYLGQNRVEGGLEEVTPEQ